MKIQNPNPKSQTSSKLQAPTWLRGVGDVAFVRVSGFNAKTQRRKDAEKTGWGEKRGAFAPQLLLPLCVSAPLRLCVKFVSPNPERRLPNRRGAERSAGFSPLHRADEGFRKNHRAGRIRRTTISVSPNCWMWLLVTAVALFTISCSVPQHRIGADLEMRNSTTNHLGWAKLVWGESLVTVGVFSPGTSAVYLDQGIPKTITTNVATIEFVIEDDPRLQIGSEDERVALKRKLIQRVPVDVTPLRNLAPGYYRITFSLLSLTNAELKVKLEPAAQ